MVILWEYVLWYGSVDRNFLMENLISFLNILKTVRKDEKTIDEKILKNMKRQKMEIITIIYIYFSIKGVNVGNMT